MKSTRPYLIRAIHEWCTDEGLTPYLAVQVNAETQVPRDFVKDGQIVLNINVEATHQLMLGNEEITFQTRFHGAAFPVVIPVSAVTAIYARENGQGMSFEPVPDTMDDSATDQKVDADGTVPDSPGQKTAPRRGTHLTRVK